MMRAVGQRLVDESIRPRILQALDVRDAPAPPLKRPKARGADSDLANIGQRLSYRGYPDYKVAQHGGKPIRDWKRTGRTLSGLKAKKSRRNQVVIGWTDPVGESRAFYNNRRWRQFGMSPRDVSNLMRIMNEAARAAKANEFPIQIAA